MNIGILVKCVITWQAALFAIISSLSNFFFKKNGAINGPVAPMKIDVKPLMKPTLKKDLVFFCFDFLKNKYHKIKVPIKGFKKSTFISEADCTL